MHVLWFSLERVGDRSHIVMKNRNSTDRIECFDELTMLCFVEFEKSTFMIDCN